MITDTDLMGIAIRAAIELDKKSKHIDTDLKNTVKLRDFIGTQVSYTDNKHIDPLQGWIVFNSVYATFGGPVPTLIAEYAEDLNRVYEKMQEVNSLQSEWLTALANFSCKLSEYAMTQSRENMSYNPNKKYFAA